MLLEFRAVPNLGERNQMIGQKWSALDSEKKEHYKEIAKKLPHEQLQPQATWKETSRLIANFEENVCV